MRLRPFASCLARHAWALTVTLSATLPVAPSLTAQSYSSAHPTPVAPNGPFDRTYEPRNASTGADSSGFPTSWLQAYGNAARNASFPNASSAPTRSDSVVSWRYAEARAWPLENDAPFGIIGTDTASALTTITQWLGNALNVTPVGGMVYAASADQFIYAINAKTGQLVWRTSPVGSTYMGNPLVWERLVYVTAGTVGFNYSNVQAFARTGSAVRGEGVAFNGVYALDRATGALCWHFDTKGDAMPTPAIDAGRLFFSTGAGNVHALDARSGKELWKAHVGGMGNMSSPAVADGRVFMGMASPAVLFALDGSTGRVLWRGTIPLAANTGMGDVSPAVLGGIVVTDAVAAADTTASPVTMDFVVRAFDAATGRPLWTRSLGRGKKPPSYKGGVPMIHDGTVYVGSPVTNTFSALDLRSGRVKWTWQIPHPGAAGSGRGPATWHDGTLYVATVGSVFALNPETGALLGSRHFGGRFGIMSPSIVGGTMYLGNSWDWVIASPIAPVRQTVPNVGAAPSRPEGMRKP